MTVRLWEEEEEKRGAWSHVSLGKYSKSEGRWVGREVVGWLQSSLHFVCKYEPASKHDCSEGRKRREAVSRK